MPPKSNKNAKPSYQLHDLELIARLDRVNAPKQARSEKRLQEIIQALETLLDGRTFEEITIPDIAEQADCVPASIYARFKSKTSILVALHESIRDRQLLQINATMTPEHHDSLSLDDSIFKICRDMTAYYSRHRNLLRPCYLLGDDEVYQRAATLLRHVSQKVSVIVLQKFKGKAPDKLDERVDLATRSIYALLQQRMVFQPHQPGRFSVKTDNDFAAELALLFKQVITGRK